MKLTIVPLSTPESITVRSKELILNAENLFLQTAEHPCSKWVTEARSDFTAFDRLYESAADFDALNEAMISAMLGCGRDAVYAAAGKSPGSPFMKLLERRCAESGVELEIIPASGYGEAALAAAGIGGMFGNIRFVEASAFPCSVDCSTALVIEEIDTAIRAGAVKLALEEYYPDEHEIVFCAMDDDGRYSARRIPLYELDRQDGYFAADVAIVPPCEFEKLERYGLDELMYVVGRLRAPGGCPWDAEQTHESMRKSLIEETYEVLDAIDRKDTEALCEELGDLLLQVCMHSQIESELREFTMRDVITGIVSKLIYRHPHVFSNVTVRDSAEVLENWEKLKRREKHQSTVADAMRSIPEGMPALMYAHKLQKKAAGVGFDWDGPEGALEKLAEESGELSEAISENAGDERIAEEAGDLLFSAVNAVRLAGCDSELVLRSAGKKFLARFERLERAITESGGNMADMTLPELDSVWERIKNDPKSE